MKQSASEPHDRRPKVRQAGAGGCDTPVTGRHGECGDVDDGGREMRFWSVPHGTDDVGAAPSTCYKGSPQQKGDRRWSAWALPSERRMQESTRGIREDHALCEGDDRRGRMGGGWGPPYKENLCPRSAPPSATEGMEWMEDACTELMCMECIVVGWKVPMRAPLPATGPASRPRFRPDAREEGPPWALPQPDWKRERRRWIRYWPERGQGGLMTYIVDKMEVL